MAFELDTFDTDDAATGPTADCYVLGGGHVGASITRQLLAADLSVTLVEESHDPDDVPVHRGDPGDIGVLADAGVGDATAVVVAAERDSRGLLIAQLVRSHFGVDEAFVVVHSPERYDVIAEVGHRPICATSALSEAVVANLDAVATELSI